MNIMKASIFQLFLMIQVVGAAPIQPVTILAGSKDFAAMPSQKNPIVLPVAGKGIIEFSVAAPAGSNLYRPGIIFSSTQNGGPEKDVTKLIVTVGDNMDAEHVNGKDAYFVQQTIENYGFCLQAFSSVPKKGASRLATLPIGLSSGMQTMHFKIILDATVLPNVFQIYAKKPSSASYPTIPLVEFSNWGASQLFTVDPSGKTYVYFTGNPYCNLTYSNITISPLTISGVPFIGTAVVVKAGIDHGMSKDAAIVLPTPGKGVVECIASVGFGSNVYRPGIVLSSTQNEKPEEAVTKLFVTLGDNMDGDHVNGKDAYIMQQTIQNYGICLQSFSMIAPEGSKPTLEPLPIEFSSRGQAVMLKFVVDATVLPNIFQVYAKKPKDDVYPEVPFIEFDNLGASQLFTVDPDGKTYFYFTGNLYANQAYSSISIRDIQPGDVRPSTAGRIVGVAVGDSDNFNGMADFASLTLPVAGKGIVEFMVSAGLGYNIYRPGIFLSSSKNAELEDGITKLIVVAGDNMDGENVHGKDAYLSQRTGDAPSDVLQRFSIMDKNLPVEKTSKGQALMLKVVVDVTVKPNVLCVYAKKPSDASYRAEPLFQFSDKSGATTQLFTVDKNGKTYLYFTGSPYGNLAYSNIVISALDGVVPSVALPVSTQPQVKASAPAVVPSQVAVPLEIALPVVSAPFTPPSVALSVAPAFSPDLAPINAQVSSPVITEAVVQAPASISAAPDNAPVPLVLSVVPAPLPPAPPVLSVAPVVVPDLAINSVEKSAPVIPRVVVSENVSEPLAMSSVFAQAETARPVVAEVEPRVTLPDVFKVIVPSASVPSMEPAIMPDLEFANAHRNSLVPSGAVSSTLPLVNPSVALSAPSFIVPPEAAMSILHSALPPLPPLEPVISVLPLLPVAPRVVSDVPAMSVPMGVNVASAPSDVAAPSASLPSSPHIVLKPLFEI